MIEWDDLWWILFRGLIKSQEASVKQKNSSKRETEVFNHTVQLEVIEEQVNSFWQQRTTQQLDYSLPLLLRS